MLANIALTSLRADWLRPLPAAINQGDGVGGVGGVGGAVGTHDGACTPSPRLHCDTIGDTVQLTYPDVCSGDEYSADYARASEMMYQRDRRFALIHDLRAVQLSSLDTSTILSDARGIAKRGMVDRVAFVMECEGFVAATVQSAIRNFCPVQPARVFSDMRSATEWCSEEGQGGS